MELHDFMPSTAEGYQAEAGTLSNTQTPIAKQDVIAAMQTVHDPEIPINIYDLGLIYHTDIDACGNVAILMTLTAPACPVAGQMPYDVAEAIAKIANIGKVTVTLTWEPAWNREMMSEDARLVLDI